MLLQDADKPNHPTPLPLEPMTPAATARHIGRNTLLVAFAFGLAAAAGLLRNMVIARHFQLGADLDAYYAAFRVPDLLFTVVAGGALSTAFIPVFAGYLSRDDRLGAWRLAAAITNWVVLIVAVGAVMVGLAAPWLVRVLIAPGFTPAQQAETVVLMRLVLVATVLFGISSVQTSVLHGFRHFLLPALAPVVYPLGVAAGAVWLTPRWGVMGLAMGAILGAALHLAVKIPALLYFGFRWWPVLDVHHPGVRRVAVLVGPRILDLGVFHLTLIAMTNLASRLDPGSVTGLEWGWDAMQLPETLIGTACGIVAFPTLAALAAAGDVAGLRRTLAETLAAVMTLAAPAAVLLILLGRPLLALLYQRGGFDAAAIAAIDIALRFFALGLIGHVCLELAARAFFAQQDMVTPLLVAAVAGAANIALGVVLMRWLAHGGLALANSLAVSAEVVVLLALLHRRWGGVEGRRLAHTLAKVLVATAVMAGVVSLALAHTQNLGRLPALALPATVGLVAYSLTCVLLREEALFYLPAALFARGPVFRARPDQIEP